MRIKRKTERPDGKVFWAYAIKNGKRVEIWISRAQFEKRENTRRKYVRQKQQEYQKNQLSLPDDQRNYIGKYNPENGLYFIRVSTVGKAVWGSLEQLNHLRNLNKKARKKYYIKCYTMQKLAVVPGDPHPTQEGVFVVRIMGGKVFYGTKDQYLEKSKKLINNYKKYKSKNKEEIKRRKKECREKNINFLKQHPHLKRSRGDIDPICRKIFWQYNEYGKEVWMRPEVFEKKRNKANANRNLKRQKNKEAKNVGKSISSKNC